MTINILVIEDLHPLGSMIAKFLTEHLHRATIAPPAEEDQYGGLRWGSQAHAHLLPNHWTASGHDGFKVACLKKDEVAKLAAADQEMLRELLAPMCQSRFQADLPDLIVTDMALNDKQQASIKRTGRAPARPYGTDNLRDPRKALEGLSGVRLAKAFVNEIPIIISTFANNPHVRPYCRLAGASDVLEKPVPDDAEEANVGQPGFDLKTAAKKDLGTLETEALENKDRLSVVVFAWLEDVLASVVTQLPKLACERTGPYLAPRLQEDLLFAPQRTEARCRKGSGQLVVSAPWLRDLEKFLERAEPDVLAAVYSAVYSAVDRELKVDDDSGRSQNFELAMAVSDGMYFTYGTDAPGDETSGAVELARCAARLPTLFAHGQRRDDLLDRVGEALERSSSVPQAARAQVLAFLGNRGHGLRLQVTAAAVPNGLWASLDINGRSMYTTTAPGMRWIIESTGFEAKRAPSAMLLAEQSWVLPLELEVCVQVEPEALPDDHNLGPDDFVIYYLQPKTA